MISIQPITHGMKYHECQWRSSWKTDQMWMLKNWIWKTHCASNESDILQVVTEVNSNQWDKILLRSELAASLHILYPKKTWKSNMPREKIKWIVCPLQSQNTIPEKSKDYGSLIYRHIKKMSKILLTEKSVE
jgi:hypothetical protein